ncbi:MAG: carbohydrate-binding protein, partial [Planctomycetota bacterium]
GALAIDLNENEIATASVPVTGGWQSWQVQELGEVFIPAGEHQLRLRITGSEFNITWMEFEKVGGVDDDLIVSGPLLTPNPVLVNETFTASVEARPRMGGVLEYQWNLSDGSGNTEWTLDPSIEASYSSPGFYTVFVRVREDGGSPEVASRRILVEQPTVEESPRQSSTIIIDADRNRVWTVNEDHGTVSMLDVENGEILMEIAVGARPRSLALDDAGRVWATSEGGDVITAIDAANGSIVRTVDVAYGSAPYGILSDPNRDVLYVSLSGVSEVIAIDGGSGAITDRLSVARHPRSLAMLHGVLYVAHFITSDHNNRVTALSTDPLAHDRTLVVPFDMSSDAENAGGGVPNYIGGIAVSPTGNSLWYPATKANVLRGTSLSGNDLNHENTVRTMVGHFDLVAGAEDPERRIDFDDSALAMSVTFGPSGSFAFVGILGNNRIDVIDTAANATLFRILNVGLAPDGMAIDPSGERLFVHAFNERQVSIFDISNIVSELQDIKDPIIVITTVAEEVLTPEVLLGKQIFYNAADPRMSMDHYISCASCHFQGGTDGQVWDFTGRGEGLRYSTELWGRSGTAHGRVHWSANFDEIQDFEHDIREAFLGAGFMSDEDFNVGTRNHPLGDPKAGLSEDLDALAAYVTSLDYEHLPRSPYREANGALSEAALRGRATFARMNCNYCHGGVHFTDSQLARAMLHDVGTIKDSSGGRLGGYLWGIDTPTLRGIWNKDVFLHDGSAASLEEVFIQGESNSVHGIVRSLESDDHQDLMTYLRSLDGNILDEPGHEPSQRRIIINTPGADAIISISPGHGEATDPGIEGNFPALSASLDYSFTFERIPMTEQ